MAHAEDSRVGHLGTARAAVGAHADLDEVEGGAVREFEENGGVADGGGEAGCIAGGDEELELDVACFTFGGEVDGRGGEHGDVHRALDAVEQRAVEVERLGDVADQATIAFEFVAQGTSLKCRTDTSQTSSPLDGRHASEVRVEDEARADVERRRARDAFDEVGHLDVALVARPVPRFSPHDGGPDPNEDEDDVVGEGRAPEGATLDLAE